MISDDYRTNEPILHACKIGKMKNAKSLKLKMDSQTYIGTAMFVLYPECFCLVSMIIDIVMS